MTHLKQCCYTLRLGTNDHCRCAVPYLELTIQYICKVIENKPMCNLRKVRMGNRSQTTLDRPKVEVFSFPTVIFKRWARCRHLIDLWHARYKIYISDTLNQFTTVYSSDRLPHHSPECRSTVLMYDLNTWKEGEWLSPGEKLTAPKDNHYAPHYLLKTVKRKTNCAP